VAFGGKPAPIDDAEIESLRRALGSGQEMEPYPYLHEGQKIRIEKGPLRGLEGILVKKEGWQIVISVQLLRRAVAVEIDPASIAPIERYDTRLTG
jgi:transcriptional antiterminator NusG